MGRNQYSVLQDWTYNVLQDNTFSQFVSDRPKEQAVSQPEYKGKQSI